MGTATVPLELKINVEPDEHGVYDGRDLARHLFFAAFNVLVPYAGACPACTDILFSELANEVMTDLHDRGRVEGQLPSAIYALSPDDSRDDRIAAHLEAATAASAAILRVARESHEH